MAAIGLQHQSVVSWHLAKTQHDTTFAVTEFVLKLLNRAGVRIGDQQFHSLADLAPEFGFLGTIVVLKFEYS